MKNKEYSLIIQTNQYAGNFERELCAHLTGQIGECGAGREYVEEDIKEAFEDIIGYKSDDNGCYRPVEIIDYNNDKYNSLEIFLNYKPSKDLLNIISERCKTFKYENMDILGIKLIKKEINIKITEKIIK